MRRFVLALVAAAFLVAPATGALAQSNVGGSSIRTATYDSTYSSQLRSTHEQLYGGERVEYWRFSGVQGDCVEIGMSSWELDSYLGLFRGAPLENLVAEDDDSGLGLDAFMQVWLPRTDTYYIAATTAGGERLGSYTLRLSRCGGSVSTPVPPQRGDGGFAPIVPPAPSSSTCGPRSHPTATAPIRVGTSCTSALTSQTRPWMRNGTGEHGEIWLFDMQSSGCVEVTMRSSEIDSYLEVGTDGVGFPVLARDDDSGGGLDARVRVTLPRAGTYYIFATAARGSAWQMGSYTLSVERTSC